MPDQKVYYLANNDFLFHPGYYITFGRMRQQICGIYIFFRWKIQRNAKKITVLFRIYELYRYRKNMPNSKLYSLRDGVP